MAKKQTRAKTAKILAIILSAAVMLTLLASAPLGAATAAAPSYVGPRTRVGGDDPAAGCIYVSPAGNDIMGDGTIGNPYKTITEAMYGVRAGSTLVLGAGTYREGKSVRVRYPNVTIKSKQGEWAIIELSERGENDQDSAVCFDVGSSGGKLQNVEVKGGFYAVCLETKWEWGDPNDRTGASNIIIEDCVLHHSANDVVKIKPACDNIIIRFNEIHHSGQAYPMDEEFLNGQRNSEGIDIVNGDNIQIQNNYIHDICSNAVYSKGGAINTLFENNFIENAYGGGILVGFDTSPQYFDTDANPQYYENIRSVVRNNLIAETGREGIGLYASLDAHIYNNTLVNVAKCSQIPRGAIHFGLTMQDYADIDGRPANVNPNIHHNVVCQQNSSGYPMIDILYYYQSELGNMHALSGKPTMNNNCYYVNGKSAVFVDGRPGNVLDGGTLAQWKTHIGGENGSVEVNPALNQNYVATNPLAAGMGIYGTGAPIAYPAITITTQPKSATFSQGAVSGTLTVAGTVAGGGTPSYAWYRRVGAYVNTALDAKVGSGSNFAIPTTLTDGYHYYYCVLSYAGAVSATSSAAVLEVIDWKMPRITIVGHPEAATVNQGSITGSLSANATLTLGGNQGGALGGVPTYKWYRPTGSKPMPSADIYIGTGKTMAIPTNLTADSNGVQPGWYYFYCEVSAPGAVSKTTRIATVTVEQPKPAAGHITITTPPQPVTNMTQGSITGTLAIAATVSNGSAPSYKWYERISSPTARDVEAGTGPVFAIPTLLAAGTHYYYCKVSATNAASVNSQVVEVRVTLQSAAPASPEVEARVTQPSSAPVSQPSAAPVITITAQPSGATVTQGAIAGYLTVSASVTQGAAPRYAWYRRLGANPAPATDAAAGSGASIPIPRSLAQGTYYYYCVVRADGAASVTSCAVKIKVEAAATNYAVVFTTQPAAVTTVTQGSISGSLTVAAAWTNPGRDPYLSPFQWYSNASYSNTGGTPIAGATGASYTIPAGLTAAGSPYYYYCVATGAAPRVASAVATVKVAAAPAPAAPAPAAPAPAAPAPSPPEPTSPPVPTALTSIKIGTASGSLPALYSVARNSVVQMQAIANPGASTGKVVWSVLDTSYATVSVTGRVTVKNKAGTVVLTAKDTVSGLSSSIVLRIS